MTAMAVSIERTDNEFIIRLPLDVDPADIQKVLEYFHFLDVVSRSKASEEDIAELSNLTKEGWSQEVKDKLAEMDEFKDILE